MSSIVICAEHVSKRYRLGTVGTGSLAHDINRAWYRIRGKEDPYLKLAEVNDRTVKSTGDYVWALKDVNFEVGFGEVMGIIGRNGAGKSTLLKILSRITMPTEGNIKIKGRLASLLEVGTGFHPELTGSENIFLNGAILGMTKKEIKTKFDEIVDFAGVEKYINTPVKRYSSGMYVRLAFAVAAHLEPEILVVDEVLAVGDAEFQKKAIGKMKEVSQGQGRTVLFVSHNMTAVKNICNKTMLLVNGVVDLIGNTEEVVNRYLSLNRGTENTRAAYDSFDSAPGNNKVRMKRMEVHPHLAEGQDIITVADPIDIEFEFWNRETQHAINLSMHVYNMEGDCIFNVGTISDKLDEGLYKSVCRIPAPLLNDGVYTVSMMVVADRSTPIINFEHPVSFVISENRAASGWHGKRPGFVRPALDFSLEKA